MTKAARFGRLFGVLAVLGVSVSLVSGVGVDDPILEKTLTAGPTEVGIALPDPTVFEFVISYSNPADVPVRILDTIPAEFEVVGLVPSAGDATHRKTYSKRKAVDKGKPQGATRVVWDLEAGVAGTLTVTIQTVKSPGKGHERKGHIVYKPTSCGTLVINDGAMAFAVEAATGELATVDTVDPDTLEVTKKGVLLAGPTEPLQVEAVAGAKPCKDDDDDPVDEYPPDVPDDPDDPSVP